MTIKIYKYADFEKFARKNRIDNESLKTAVAEIESGLVDADLGGGVIKKRIARHNKGKSGGFRTLLLFKRGKRAIYASGFSKGKKANITEDELDGLKALADHFLRMPDHEFTKYVENGDFTEI